MLDISPSSILILWCKNNCFSKFSSAEWLVLIPWATQILFNFLNIRAYHTKIHLKKTTAIARRLSSMIGDETIGCTHPAHRKYLVA
jgi:hypothetical protein